jgi:hypothetical protein
MATFLGKEVSFAIGDAGSPEAFSVVANVLSIGSPARSFDFEDVTFHGQPDLAKRSVPTLFSEGVIPIEFMYDSDEAEHVILYNRITAAASNPLYNYQLTWNAEFTATFAAYIGPSTWDTKIGTHVKLTANLRVEGAITYAPVP